MFLGVDGGGTKTAFVVINSDGEVLGAHQGAAPITWRSVLTGSARSSARELPPC